MKTRIVDNYGRFDIHVYDVDHYGTVGWRYLEGEFASKKDAKEFLKKIEDQARHLIGMLFETAKRIKIARFTRGRIANIVPEVFGTAIALKQGKARAKLTWSASTS